MSRPVPVPPVPVAVAAVVAALQPLSKLASKLNPAV